MTSVGAVFVEDVNRAFGTSFPTMVGPLIRRGGANRLAEMLAQREVSADLAVPLEDLRYAAPYANPPKIWGIGLNTRNHARDLDADVPESPGSFMRPASALADPGSETTRPPWGGVVTGEGEIGVILAGHPTKPGVEGAREAVWGFAPLLDLTAEGLLRRNVRYLTRAKAFPRSVTFGPWIVSRDEWEFTRETRVRTLLNGAVVREGFVADMTWSPYDVVDRERDVFEWEACDLVQSGTPGAVPLAPGDEVAAEVEGLGRVSLRVARGP